MDEKKCLLSVKDLVVKFNVRGRILTAIRGISLDIYENESIAIVGESGSGKSVFTKTFAGMLDSNGFIDNGKIIFYDEELADTSQVITSLNKKTINFIWNKLNEYSKYEFGKDVYSELAQLEIEKRDRAFVNEEVYRSIKNKIADEKYKNTELKNEYIVLKKSDKQKAKALKPSIDQSDKDLAALEKEMETAKKQAVLNAKNDATFVKSYNDRKEALKKKYAELIKQEISDETKERNKVLADEVYLSVGRYPLASRVKLIANLLKALKKAMQAGADLNNEEIKDNIFGDIAFRVHLVSKETNEKGDEIFNGTCANDLAHIKYDKDWSLIRGRRIATVFQDPMTSLNPIITIGKQISSIIMKHQGVSEVEARRKAIELMHKVGIPNAENRYDDYPFQYSGGMRQRIVIAIALSCQPKILICDEPTTALDVTIQAQILQLIKTLQKEFKYTIVFITHDLGVVANIADRVAVLYGGQIVELGNVEDVFYDPRHPYTWALLSSLPQLAERNTKLYSIAGTPPSLYNKIIGDAFAPRNPYCLEIDRHIEPPMFKISETHYAKTWLADSRAPKVEKPEIIQNIHEKLIKAYNI